VIIAACIPTLRPFFHKAFGSKSSLSGTGPSATRSGSGFKLSANLTASNGVKRLPSEADLQFGERDHRVQNDAESHSSQQGIWRTTEVNVDSDSIRDLESGPVSKAGSHDD
jgi:hypothetical protein